MDAELLRPVVEKFLLSFGLLVIVYAAIRFFLIEYRLHKRDSAEVLTARATVYYKHPDMEPVLTGRASTYVYYITFHTDSGDILKLYMTGEHYYNIHEGETGNLTWQANRFWKFEKEE